MAIIQVKQKPQQQQDIDKIIQEEVDSAFEFSMSETGALTKFVEEFDEKFDHVSAYIPLLHAALYDMIEYGITKTDAIRIFLDIIDSVDEEASE